LTPSAEAIEAMNEGAIDPSDACGFLPSVGRFWWPRSAI
jgi:hypothetical protein